MVSEDMLGNHFGVSGVFFESIAGAQHGMRGLCVSQNRTLSSQQGWWHEALMVKMIAGYLSHASHSQDSAALDLVSGFRIPLVVSCLRASHMALCNPYVQNVQKTVEPFLQDWKRESGPSSAT